MVFTPGGFAGHGLRNVRGDGLDLARPDQPAICVTSDGSFMMFPGAVATATEYDIPAVWVILKTTRSASSLPAAVLHGWPGDRHGFRQALHRRVLEPGLRSRSRKRWGRVVSVEDPADLGTALETALATGNPYVVDVRVNRDTAVPLIGTWKFDPIPQAGPTFGKPLILS